MLVSAIYPCLIVLALVRSHRVTTLVATTATLFVVVAWTARRLTRARSKRTSPLETGIGGPRVRRW